MKIEPIKSMIYQSHVIRELSRAELNEELQKRIDALKTGPRYSMEEVDLELEMLMS